ncbi:uncharacterized protein [Apostichopus japonicus]|uniref:uncharacterized protein n=1 Tax=Stichopus japonicus TaxID=307972 RepID=UPI003AB34439
MAQQVVLITGCSTGMGLDFAVTMARNEKYIVYASMRNLAKKSELEKQAGDSLSKTLFIKQLDVTKEDEIKSVVAEIHADRKRIDILGTGRMKNLVSTLVPGPVKITFIENVKKNDLGAFADSIDADADEETKKLAGNMSGKMQKMIGSESQSPEDITRLLLEVAATEKPHLRYATSKAMTELMSGKDAVDSCGALYTQRRLT